MKEIYADKYRQIGLKIAYYRKLRGLTQEQLAEKLELSPAFIGHVEAPNVNKAVSLDTVRRGRRIGCAALQVPAIRRVTRSTAHSIPQSPRCVSKFYQILRAVPPWIWHFP